MPIDPELSYRPLRRFANDDTGAVAVIVSLLLMVLLGFVALGVDVASLYRDRAQLQSASDLTAMSAMADTDNATQMANTTLERNSMDTQALTTLQTGRFLRNPAIPASSRFTALSAGDPLINAVSVTLTEDSPLHFARIFSDDSHVSLNRTALAVQTGAASFSLTSNLIRIDAAALNDAISNRLSITANLSVGDIDVLANSSVTLGALLEVLADQIGLISENPAEILNADAAIVDVIAALQTLLPASVANRLAVLLTASGSLEMAVAALVSGIDPDLGLTAMEFLAEIDISALSVVQAITLSGTPEYAVTAATALNIPGVASVTADVSMGEPAAHSGWIALGETGAKLHRAAARLSARVEVDPTLLGGLGIGVSVASLNLPVYVELAGSTATLDELSCRLPQTDSVAARFITASTPLDPANGTSVVALYLGELPHTASDIAIVDPSDLEFADLLDLNIVISLPIVGSLVINGVTVQARSHVAVGQSQAETLSFTKAEITAGQTTKGFGSGQLLTTAVTGLLAPENTELRVKPGQDGILAGVAGPLIEVAMGLLPLQLATALTTPLDAVLDALLAEAGLHLGEGELTLTGHHCELIRLAR